MDIMGRTKKEIWPISMRRREYVVSILLKQVVGPLRPFTFICINISINVHLCTFVHVKILTFHFYL